MSKISIRPEVRRPPGPSRCSGRSTGEDLLAGWDRLPRVRDRWADTPSRTVRTEISNRIPSSGPKDGPRLHARNRASPPSGLWTWYSERFPARHRRTEGCGESVARGPLSLPSRLGLRDPRPTTSDLDFENFPARRGPTDGCGELVHLGPRLPLRNGGGPPRDSFLALYAGVPQYPEEPGNFGRALYATYRS